MGSILLIQQRYAMMTVGLISRKLISVYSHGVPHYDDNGCDTRARL